jgi:uncharacterized protein (DUF1800 family)
MTDTLESRLHEVVRDAGLSYEQAAACLLNRLTYGAQPEDEDRVVAMGLAGWLEEQLLASLPEPELEARLTAYPALSMDIQTQVSRYPDIHLVYAHARRFYDLIPPVGTPVDAEWRERRIAQFRKEHGYLDEGVDLYRELAGQKLIRARYARNQLAEVLTDFWFNHFYVTPTHFRARTWVMAYERDAIRPNVLTTFRTLLGASARHPAMLWYLDNAQSTALPGVPTSMQMGIDRLRRNGGSDRVESEARLARIQAEIDQMEAEEQAILDKEFRPRSGINENYARELLELHTLGVDGGYTQRDVSEVARAFTGWTVYPIGITPEWFKTGFDAGQGVGFFREGHFLFRPDWHDATEKQVLGEVIPAGGGREEGERILDRLARHPSTARHLARKLAIRFVCEEPAPTLVDRLAAVFLETSGDVRQVMEALVTSREFWQEAARRSKIKSPFELVVSALRALDAEVTETTSLVEWCAKMGQPLYGFQAPTGFPDRGLFWINAGTLLSRINFGLALVNNEIAGVRVERIVEGASEVRFAAPAFQCR